MNIIVCIKQVPGTTQVEVDPETGVLKRDGVASKMNPYDLFGLEAAFRIREEVGGTVTALSMGPAQATASLLEAVYMGADKGMLLSDRKFAGADVHATSYAITCGIEKLGHYDLIICGKQTTDGDTAQVGPETAEWLGIDHATNVCEINEVEEGGITVTFQLDGCVQTQKMQFPCLITVEKDAFTPRLPSYKRKTAYKAEDCITVCTAADLPKLDESLCGLKGSPTQVERIFPPEKNDGKQTFEGDADTLASSLLGLLKDRKFL